MGQAPMCLLWPGASSFCDHVLHTRSAKVSFQYTVQPFGQAHHVMRNMWYVHSRRQKSVWFLAPVHSWWSLAPGGIERHALWRWCVRCVVILCSSSDGVIRHSAATLQIFLPFAAGLIWSKLRANLRRKRAHPRPMGAHRKKMCDKWPLFDRGPALVLGVGSRILSPAPPRPMNTKPSPDQAQPNP